ncbi:MAG TPA: efflux RND transporter periplasmic adaptor subunit [Acetobacteraceae bacterium]
MKRLLLVLLLLGAAGGGAYYWYVLREPPAAEAANGTPTRGGSRRRGGSDGTPIPVLTARSEQRDVPVWLDGLGTVQAFNQVQIRPFVDGPLVEVRFQEGQSVKTGDVLARIDPRSYQASLDAATAKKQQDEATLANARLDVGRYAKLAAGQYSSGQQVDTARATAAQLEAQVRGDQAQIDTARTNLGYTTITAPIDGRVGIRQVDAGNLVRATDLVPLTVLTQLKPISVVFTLPQQALPAVAAAMQEGMPEVLALRQGGDAANPLDRGQLAVLDNQVDPATGTIKLKATFPNDKLLLWPGGFANIRMLSQTLRGVTTVPTAAVQRGPRGAYIYVVNGAGEAQRREVKVGHEDDGTSVIAEGMKPGEQVVTDGAQRLTEGAKVAVAGPDGNAPDAVAQERVAPGTGGKGRRRTAGAG